MLAIPSTLTGWLDLALLALFVGFFWALGAALCGALVAVRFNRPVNRPVNRP